MHEKNTEYLQLNKNAEIRSTLISTIPNIQDETKKCGSTSRNNQSNI